MTNKKKIAALLLAFWFSANANANIILNEWVLNINGSVSESANGDELPGISSSLNSAGLGNITLEFTNPGDYFALAYFDFEIDEANNTFFNEYGSVFGTPSEGQSWEIDEPGYIFGDIYDNVFDGFLDNTNSVPENSNDDVSFAIGWDFTLLNDQIASLSFTLSDMLNTSGFHLLHVDDEVGSSFSDTETVYFWSALSIEDTNVNPPSEANAPSIFALLIASVAFLVVRKKSSVKH
ncbi:hypothetical protein ISG33_08655 [Glaciecola sp. MH2013]|uniref:hypothetical protein n=1 Tax=Glaciecola sp. MH2013 TaxID=2785524 RepID=UPI00189CE43E|nr:hypothetical protein [Glaciecola sp. MH2013]MBF7073463.1 hypothetical protein [Glaciecola sp. MH2013]